MFDEFMFGVLSFLRNGLLGATGWQVFWYAIFTTHLTIVSVTLYLHRSQSHRSIEISPFLAHIFRFWLWANTGMVTREWAAIHRKHHAKVETADDPHSPQIFGIGKVLLEGAELYRIEAKNQDTLQRYGKGTPDDWIERKLYSAHSALGLLLTLVANFLLFGIIGVTIFAIQMVWIPFWAAGVINGLAHFWGYRNFDCPDASRNLLPVGIIVGGEEMHNNHHAYPSSAKFSVKWYEFDIGWMYITLFSWLGLVKVLRVAPAPKFSSEYKSVVDFDTLQALIAHRYDLMARYAKSLRKACMQEAKRLAAARHPAGELVSQAIRWLHMDVSRLSDSHRSALSKICDASSVLEKLVRMRKELANVWESTSLSREQLVCSLQKWCYSADESEIPALREISKCIRSYVV